MLYGDSPQEGYVSRGQTFLHGTLGIRFDVPDNMAIRFDGVAGPKQNTLANYLTSVWVEGLIPETVRETHINGLEAATEMATTDKWDFNITVIHIGQQIFRFLTVVPKGIAQLDLVANVLRTTFRRITPQEIASLKPLRIRVVTVKTGESVATIAARMMGTKRKLDMFRMMNSMITTAKLQPGQRVKIIAE